MRILRYYKDMKKETRQFETRQFMNASTLEVFHYQDNQMESVPLHHHDFYELIFFIRGNVDYRVETEVFPLEAGDIIFVPCGVFHQPVIKSDDTYERIVLWINRDFLEGAFRSGEINSFLHSGRYIFKSRDSYDRIYTLLQILLGHDSDDALREDYERSLAALILAECSRLAAEKENVSSGEKDPLIADILQYLNDHYREDISLDSLASSLGFSKYYLSHLFREKMGTSLYQYILSKRLIHAYDLLVSGNKPQEVSRLSGFHDYVNFYRTFKDEFSITPSALYRRYNT